MHPLTIALALLLGASCASATDHVIPNRDHQALRSALASASASPGAGVRITLAEGGLYALADVLPGQLGLPELRGHIRIDGSGAEIRRYTDEPMTLLQVAAGARVTLSNVTLAEANLGAIRNLGWLELDNVRITDSSGEAARAIVVNHGDMVVRRSEFSFNEVHGSGRDAGTLVNFGTLTLSDSLIRNNTLSRRYPSLATAAVLNHGRLTLSASQFEDNNVLDDFGGLTSHGVLNLLGGSVDGEIDSAVRNETTELAIQSSL